MRNTFISLALLTALAACDAPERRAAAEAEAKAAVPSPESIVTAYHIGNAGVMIKRGDTKILFDPLYRNGYNNYHLVPEAVKADVMAGEAPYDNINAILISHAHGDHFDAEDMVLYHQANPETLIIAPPQAIEEIEKTGKVNEAFRARFVPMGLDYGADPLSVQFEGLSVEAVRIPHAGGPARRGLENLVYRVTLEGEATVMHMGDADPALEHYSPYQAHWQAQRTGTAFPPYWFFLSAQGTQIVDEVLNAQDAIGVHVPVEVPDGLVASGRSFFGDPGSVQTLRPEAVEPIE